MGIVLPNIWITIQHDFLSNGLPCYPMLGYIAVHEHSRHR